MAQAVSSHVDGNALASALVSGIHRVIGEQDLLNHINVFPVADGDTGTLSRTSRSDRVVWATAGVLLAGAGLLAGPSWPLMALGISLFGFALLRSVLR